MSQMAQNLPYSEELYAYLLIHSAMFYKLINGTRNVYVEDKHGVKFKIFALHPNGDMTVWHPEKIRLMREGKTYFLRKELT